MADSIDPRLKDWATARQAEIIDAVNVAGGNYTKAARALGLGNNRSYLVKAVAAVKQSAAKRGYAPEGHMTHPVPSPFMVSGTSTLFDEDGKARLQWVKTRIDGERLEQAVRAAVEALAEGVPRAVKTKAPKGLRGDLLTLYTLTDSHVGMKSWQAETGGDWDLSIAEQTLTGAITELMRAAPNAETGFINQLGDFLHYDSLKSVTPEHGHLLDADSRYEKMVRVAVRILRAVIDMALAKHKRVVVVMAEGNHDMASSVWLRHLFGLLYEKEPRVTVIDSPLPYYVHQHGETLLAFHHGHLSKNDSLPLLFAAQFPKHWGETTRRYCHTGHRHHVEEKEHSGMTVIQHPTIAARDAYAARGGWVADRSMTAITYHARHGQVARHTVVPEMLESA